VPARPARPTVIDAVVPARNEAATVAAVVEACRACRAVREVIVVDDGSVDSTGDRAAAAGAKVIQRHDVPPGAEGSKAHAMEAGHRTRLRCSSSTPTCSG
jgi:glycosyltransferase involved in cell wall biosynthesis